MKPKAPARISPESSSGVVASAARWLHDSTQRGDRRERSIGLRRASEDPGPRPVLFNRRKRDGLQNLVAHFEKQTGRAVTDTFVIQCRGTHQVELRAGPAHLKLARNHPLASIALQLFGPTRAQPHPGAARQVRELQITAGGGLIEEAPR